MSGQPRAAVMHLLRLVVSTRGTLHYHCDFDWGGIRMANVLHDRVPSTPWRFDTASYSLPVTSAGHSLVRRPEPAGSRYSHRP